VIDGFAVGCLVVVSAEDFVKDVTCTCARPGFGAQSAQLVVFVIDGFAVGCLVVVSAEDFVKDVICTCAGPGFGAQSAQLVVFVIDGFAVGCLVVVSAEDFVKDVTCTCAGPGFDAQSAQLVVFVIDGFAMGCLVVVSAEDFVKDVTCTCARPLKPRARAAAMVRSITRPRTYGPRSFILTTTLRPFVLLITNARVPKGSERCAAVSALADKLSPLAVFSPEVPYVDATPV